MNHLISITKSDGTRQLFEEDKLVDSLHRAGATEEAIEEVVAEVERTMKDGAKTDAIYRLAFDLLKKHSHHIAVKYSVRRALVDLGPDGFPFERFVARIFQSWGYQTVTDQVVLGGCITHEIDVVAWNNKELHMIEAKFHNEFGMKSDSKVALYIEARREDISSNFYDYGDIKRKISGFWLVTNTKFTDQAIKYGECKGLKMIGWNYPTKGNLHDIIEEKGLHPITCINSLSHQQKKDLIGRNIVVCVDLIKQSQVLNEIGVKGDLAAKVLEEVQTIVGK